MLRTRMQPGTQTGAEERPSSPTGRSARPGPARQLQTRQASPYSPPPSQILGIGAPSPVLLNGGSDGGGGVGASHCLWVRPSPVHTAAPQRPHPSPATSAKLLDRTSLTLTPSCPQRGILPVALLPSPLERLLLPPPPALSADPGLPQGVGSGSPLLRMFPCSLRLSPARSLSHP